MKMLIVAEKPSLVAELIKSLENNNEAYERWFKKYDTIEVIYSLSFASYKFNYPTKQPYKKYPMTLPIQTKFNKVDANQWHHYQTLTQNQDGQITTTQGDYLEPGDTTHHYDDLLYIVNYSYRGVFAAEQLMEHIFGMKWEQRFKNIFFPNCSRIYAEKFENLVFESEKEPKKALEDKQKLKKMAHIKYYFDYNYNLNSLVFTNQIIRAENPDKVSLKINYMSKYVVMLYMILVKKLENDEIPKTLDEHKIFKIMETWVGSGKNQKNGYQTSIGSPASRAAIVESLLEIGLLTRGAKNLITIKNTTQFVKKMFDPDLPFRLDEWMRSQKPLKEVLHEIDTYLIAMFSRQKAKNNKQFKYNTDV